MGQGVNGASLPSLSPGQKAAGAGEVDQFTVMSSRRSRPVAPKKLRSTDRTVSWMRRIKCVI